MKPAWAAVVLAFGLVSGAHAQTVQPRMPVPKVPVVAPPLSPEDQAAVLRDDALKANAAYDWVEELTTRFGARPAGSASEKAAAEWAVQKLKTLGFDEAHLESFPLQLWKRGPESVEITAPFPQKLVGVSLGGSSATPAAGIEAEAAIFDTWQQFLDFKGDVAGKIVV
ncbi:MAG: M20/M25/M40 family metallo-hydrolase, partial [Asticcacaulis sp.]